MVSEMNTGKQAESNKRSFLRFQVTALLATCVDFAFTIFFKEIVDFHYSVAVAMGATMGAITAFSLNRYWVFRAHEKNPVEQAVRYIIVAGGSIVLNTAGTYIVTESFNSPYLVSK